MSNENVPIGIRSTRRNLVKIGALVASALLASTAKITPAAARCPGGGDDDDDDGGGRHCCFLKGTTIQTANGARKVEELMIGDRLPTVFGGVSPIQWVARSSFRKSDPSRAWGNAVLPVRIARSALADNVPHGDLYVTRSHALLFDEILVQAGSLINGTTITLYPARELDELEYFHIKLAEHDVIYAEGAPCESLLGVDENAVNFPEYYRRYGVPLAEETPCVPIMSSGGRSELKSRLRSAISPWIDRRQKVDIIRDQLEQRGISLLRQSELV
jgi:hypothetical protein